MSADGNAAARPSDSELVALALEAREASYSPYSHFAVGAALLDVDGRVWQGCNIENAAYGPGNCAERTAIFKAVSEGSLKFESIAVVGGPAGAPPVDYAAPCGICRQVMREFCDVDSFRVILGISPEEYKVFTLGELLPESFGPENLG